jgi:hypothetical protein
VTTVVIARFGLAGTIFGAALAPVLVPLLVEGVRRPAERVRGRTTAFVARSPREGRRGLRFSLDRISCRRVVAIGLGAFVAVVGAFTLLDLARGESPVSERGTTFFMPGEEGPSEWPREEPAPEHVEPGEETPPAPPTTTEPPPTVTEPPPTTTEPPPSETVPS